MLPAPCPHEGSRAARGQRHFWEPCRDSAHLVSPSPEEVGAPWGAFTLEPEHGDLQQGVVEGQFGKQWQGSRAGAPHSWKFVSRGEQRNPKAPIDAAQLARLPSIFS